MKLDTETGVLISVLCDFVEEFEEPIKIAFCKMYNADPETEYDFETCDRYTKAYQLLLDAADVMRDYYINADKELLYEKRSKCAD